MKALQLSISEAREKLTQLDRILRPGETIVVSRRGRPFARIELLPQDDPTARVLKILEALPPTKGEKKKVAARYKELLYGKQRG